MKRSFRDKQYELITQLSDNGFTQSWQAREVSTGQPVFAKVPSGDSSLDLSFIVDTLRISAQEQVVLPLRLTIRNRKFLSTDASCLVDYPWLDNLRPLPDVLADPDELKAVFTEVALITDYLHALELVHRDLKLSNFVQVRTDRATYIALTDLDLLAPVNTPGDQKIFGTPGFIAPEVTGNRVFTARADVYSLGRSAEAFFQRQGRVPLSGPWQQLLAALTEPNPYSRPEYLLEALRRFGILTDTELQQALKRLLGILLFSRFRRRKPGGAGWLERFVHDQNRVLGLPTELLGDLEVAYISQPGVVLRAVRRLIEQAEVSRLGEHWLLRVADDVVSDVYRLLGRGLETEFGKGSEKTTASILPGILYRFHDHPLKRLLAIKQLLAKQSDLADPEHVDLLMEAGDLAMTLSRSREACDFFERALGLEMSDRKSLDLHRKLVLQLVILSRLEPAAEINDRALSLARRVGDNEALLDIRRQVAWFAASRGQLDEAAEMLKAIGEEARAANLEFVRIRCLIADLYRYNRMLQPERAYQIAEAIVTASDTAGHPEYSYGTRIGLVLQHCVSGNFRKAEAYAQQIERLVVPPHLNYSKVWFYNNRFIGLTRLGDFGRARYWLRRTLADTDTSSPDFVFRRYFTGLAFMQIEQGKLLEAEQNALRSLTFEDLSTGAEYLGPAYQILCNASMRMGKFEACEDFGSKAAEYFDPVRWPLYAEEVAMLRDLNRIYNGDGLSWNGPLDRLSRLFEMGGLYYAVNLTFHILVNADDDIARRAHEIFERATAEMPDGEFPLLSATRSLALGRTPDIRQRVSLSKALKASIRSLEQIGEMFLSMLLCERIAAIDSEDVSRRRARGYLEMALTYAGALSNETAEQRIIEKLTALGDGGHARQKMLESILSISQIFSEKTDYENALTRLLRFAVDESGAERGALFLISSQTGQLLLRASVDCDEASLRDIEGISGRLLSRATLDSEPKVIPDAREDENLQNYKSVVANNIRSVATVPIFSDSKLRAILYMDHHTVPARFDDADLLYIRTIANFMNHVLDAIDRQRASEARLELFDSDRRDMGIPENLVAESPAMLKLLKDLPQIARTNTSILVRGESGTGKELLVEMIHALSLRADKPLVKLNCAAISDDLMEVELFGIRGGTASNVEGRIGKFEFADGGTLFLDEIGDMSSRIQAAVLRCLEYQSFERIGSHRTIHTDIRFVYATNKNLEEMVENGTFRLDLFQRIQIIDLIIPPLRERPEDILPLINYFGAALGGVKAPPIRFAKDALAAIMAHRWPGNVRELRNLVERLVILKRSGEIGRDQLPEPIKSARDKSRQPQVKVSADESRLVQLAADLKIDLRWLEPDLEASRQPGNIGLSSQELLERETIRVSLTRNKGNVSKTARTLNYPVATLRRRIKKYGLNHGL